MVMGVTSSVALEAGTEAAHMLQTRNVTVHDLNQGCLSPLPHCGEAPGPFKQYHKLGTKWSKQKPMEEHPR